VFDPALLRPGRFDRQVVVDMPDMKEREAILGIHITKIPLAENIDVTRLARSTPGASGADLANLVNEAALFAARKNRDKVEMEDFEEARDKLFMGMARRSKTIDDKEKLATSYHEAGHALLHYYLKDADPLHKVTVVPRGRALGVAWSLPEKDHYTRSRGYFQDRISISYGGYVAEELVYGETTSGTVQDIKGATDLARRMVCEWGMSKLGPVAFGAEEEPIFLGKEIARHKDYSEQTARQIDDEVNAILSKGLETARDILRTHRGQLDSLAQELVLRETLTDSEVRVLLGFPPLGNGDAHDTNKDLSETVAT
jgi:cell division protease FtsH